MRSSRLTAVGIAVLTALAGGCGSVGLGAQGQPRVPTPALFDAVVLASADGDPRPTVRDAPRGARQLSATLTPAGLDLPLFGWYPVELVVTNGTGHRYRGPVEVRHLDNPESGGVFGQRGGEDGRWTDLTRTSRPANAPGPWQGGED